MKYEDQITRSKHLLAERPAVKVVVSLIDLYGVEVLSEVLAYVCVACGDKLWPGKVCHCQNDE